MSQQFPPQQPYNPNQPPNFNQPPYQQPQYQPPQYQPPMPPKKKGMPVWVWIVGGIFGLAVIGAISNAITGNTGKATPTAAVVAAAPTANSTATIKPTEEPKATATPRPTATPNLEATANAQRDITASALRVEQQKIAAQTAAAQPPTPTATPKPTPAPPTVAPTAVPTKIAGIGTPVESGSYKITVNKVESANTFDNIFKAAAGKVYVAVDITVESRKNDASANSFYCTLRDADAFSYTATLLGKDPTLGSQNNIPVGQKLRGWVTFEVPAEAKGLVFQYKPLSFTDSTIISIALT